MSGAGGGAPRTTFARASQPRRAAAQVATEGARGAARDRAAVGFADGDEHRVKLVEERRIGWQVRATLGLDHLKFVAGVSGDATRPDNIVFDIVPNPFGGTGNSAGGFGHPTCLNTSGSETLPPVR